jgi:hypothetical protein
MTTDGLPPEPSRHRRDGTSALDGGRPLWTYRPEPLTDHRPGTVTIWHATRSSYPFAVTGWPCFLVIIPRYNGQEK